MPSKSMWNAGLTAILFSPLLVWASAFADADDQGEESPVAAQMEIINRTFRELRRQIDEPEAVEANLALIEKMKLHLRAASKEEPSKTADLPDAERGAFLAAFRSLLDDVIDTLDELARAVQQKRWDETKRLIKKLNSLKKEGHSKFRKE